jgi:hypothetical protein
VGRCGFDAGTTWIRHRHDVDSTPARGSLSPERPENSTVLSLQLDGFMIELTDGSIKNVGAPNKSGTAKLYDVDHAEARAFGDERVKLAFADDEGNEVAVALAPAEAQSIAREIESLESESPVFE